MKKVVMNSNPVIEKKRTGLYDTFPLELAGLAVKFTRQKCLICRISVAFNLFRNDIY